MSIDVISGQKIFNKMTSKLSDKDYAVYKANIWMQMLRNAERPTKWLKANTKGTKVSFDFIKSKEEFEAGVLELEAYLVIINKEHDLDFSIERE